MKNIALALVKAQSQMSDAKKGNTNPFFKSKYADLNSVREAVIPILNEHGISVLQPIVNVDGKNFVKTLLLHESGEMIDSFTEIVFSKQNDAQAQGSGITYARRYGLQSLVCIGTEDDDGNKASEHPKAKTGEQLLGECKTIEELATVYKSLSLEEQTKFVRKKDAMKAALTPTVN